MLNRRHAALICAALTIGYLIVGLWPFNFIPRNNVEWLQNQKGIHFRQQSVVYSEKVLEPASAVAEAESTGMTIELLLEPESEPAGNIFPIMSIYDGDLPENILVAQWKSWLLVRAPIWNHAGPRKYREIGVNGALRRSTPRFIAITSGAAGTCFYVDEAVNRCYPKVMLGPKTLRGRLILGDASTGGPSWMGKLHGLGLLKRQLDASEILRHCRLWSSHSGLEIASEPGLAALYIFDEGQGRTISDHSSSNSALVIPAVYRVFRKTVLLRPWNNSVPNVPHIEDVVVNILGFVPFGFFSVFYFMGGGPSRTFRNTALTVLVGGIISAVIELSQVFLPTRSSSLTDLICNTAGSLIGALYAFVAQRLVGTPAQLSARPSDGMSDNAPAKLK